MAYEEGKSISPEVDLLSRFPDTDDEDFRNTWEARLTLRKNKSGNAIECRIEMFIHFTYSFHIE